MKKFKITISLLVILISGLFATKVNINAESYDEFSVDTIIPENQIDKNKTYFDLLVTANQKQIIEVTLINTGDQEMIATTKIHDAQTLDNGVIDYLNSGSRDKSLILSTTDVVTVLDEEVIIQPNTSTNVRLEISMPAQEYDGNILGGIVFSGKTTNEEETNTDTTIAINNEIVYVVGLNLNMNENIVDPNLNLKKIEEKLVNHTPAVIANIQNDQAIIMSGVSISGKVSKKGTKEILSTINYTEAKIAPNTNFDVIYDWGGKSIKNGIYELEMKIQWGNDSWEWREEFEIKNADVINDGNYFAKEKDPNLLLIIICAIGIGLLLGIGIMFLFKKRKKEKTI